MIDELKNIIEATLLAAGRPVPLTQLIDLFDERERPTPEQVTTALQALAQDYSSRGLELVEVASGWRVQVRGRYVDAVSRLWQERPARYSRALLETLALIAYRQPITRSEIEEIRGVSISSTIMRTLQERNWIRTVGHREVPGRPELLGTTREFLDYFGLKSLEDLPALAELKDVETIGVQLELNTGEAPATESGMAEAEGGAPEVDSTGTTTDGPTASSPEAHNPEPQSADADTVDEEADDAVEDDEADGDASSTLVAHSDEHGGVELREPPKYD